MEPTRKYFTTQCNEEKVTASERMDEHKVECGRDILKTYFMEEHEKIDAKRKEDVNTIKRNNASYKAIIQALKKAQKPLSNQPAISHFEEGFLETIYMDTFLTQEEKCFIEIIFNKAREAHEALDKKWSIAINLLNMADTYEERLAILKKYTKDVI